MGQVQGGWLLCLRMPSFSSEIEAASGVSPKNAILSITDLDRTPVVPNCRRLLHYPNQQTLGAFLAPAGPLALQINEYPLFWPFTPLKFYCRMLKIKIILPTSQTIAYMLSNHPRPMPTTFQSADDCIVVITWQFVVCRVATSPSSHMMQFVT